MYYTGSVSISGAGEASGRYTGRGRAGDGKSGHITGFGRYFEAVVKRKRAVCIRVLVYMYAITSVYIYVAIIILVLFDGN